MKNFIITFIFFTLANISFSQNYIFLEDEPYESTNTWQFKASDSHYMDDPRLTVAKKDNSSGYLMISANTSNTKFIGGNVFIFLENGKMIKCTDTNIRDYVDRRSISIYSLTKDEIELLKSERIVKIRYSIMDAFENKQAFTAYNRKRHYIMNGIVKKYYETKLQIRELFK